jgi:D-alanyl-D-alanine carboxypeptidase (penicillin-binding protein 5/6)
MCFIPFKKSLCVLLTGLIVFCTAVPAHAEEVQDTDSLSLSAESVCIMEASTGTIIYEKNADKRLRPASVTKIMTLLLIFDALENGQFSLEDTVTVSAHAAGMGGSQVFLEEGETQTVRDMIKCISIASANDAATAMAEFVAGTEEAFVERMNERAKELGMANTTFVNCCGLEAEGHLTTARDIALMSRELITKYPQIHDYCTVWQDSITHETRRGSSEFTLTNTNKFLKQYDGANGLKTGYTSLAKYCISATASRDDMELITVLMAEPDIKSRVADLQSAMNYGFSVCNTYTDPNEDSLEPLPVSRGKESQLPIVYDGAFTCVDTTGRDLSAVEKTLSLPEQLEAPIQKGDIVGEAAYTIDGKLLGSVSIRAAIDIEQAGFSDFFGRAAQAYFK